MMKSTILLLFFPACFFAQKSGVFQIDSLSVKGTLLDKNWKAQTGDNPDWAGPGFDDSGWAAVDPTKEIKKLPAFFDARIKWLRLDFEVKSKLPNLFGLSVTQAGASEIYLNGRLIHQFGHFDTDPSKVVAYDPLQIPVHLPVDSVGRYTLAVRYALQPNVRYTNIFGHTKNRFFCATAHDLVPTLHQQRSFSVYRIGIEIFILGISLMLFIMHLALYLYQRANRTHFYLAVYLFSVIVIRVFKIIGQNQSSIEGRYYSLNTSNWSFSFVAVCLAFVLYKMAKLRLDAYFYSLSVFYFFYGMVSSFSYGFPLQTVLFLIGTILSFFILIRLVRIGLKKRIAGFLTLTVGVMFTVFALLTMSSAILFWNYSFSASGFNDMKYGISPYLIDLIMTLGSVSLPISLSLFMGIQGNEINKRLSKKLIENDQLKNDAIGLEQEKQQILATQNETLEEQVAERTAELNRSLETLKAAQNQLIQSEKLASLGELTAGIAHEIQNPLNFVNNFSELSVELAEDLKAELGKNTPDQSFINELMQDLSENQQKINHHGKRAASIVTGMLQHARTSTGKKEPTDLNALADEFLRLSFHGLRAKDSTFNAKMETDLDPNIGKTAVIPQDLGRVFLNLMNNAFYAVAQRKKTATGAFEPTVWLTSKLENGVVEIRVRDNGTGIPDDVRAKIFQPFFTTKPTGEGTGLGLSLAYDIITKGHGGSFEVSSEPGEGTEFLIVLPQ